MKETNAYIVSVYSDLTMYINGLLTIFDDVPEASKKGATPKTDHRAGSQANTSEAPPP